MISWVRANMWYEKENSFLITRPRLRARFVSGAMEITDKTGGEKHGKEFLCLKESRGQTYYYEKLKPKKEVPPGSNLCRGRADRERI